MMLASTLCQVQCCSADQCSVQIICMHVPSGVVMPHVQPYIIAEFVNHQSEEWVGLGDYRKFMKACKLRLSKPSCS